MPIADIAFASTTVRSETVPGEVPVQPEPQPNQPDSDPGEPDPGSREFPEEGGPDQVGQRNPDDGAER
jgi:hypothetical protein